VIGALLENARRVVVKAHQPRETCRRLQAVHDMQAELFQAGFPCPEPLVAPVALGGGWSLFESERLWPAHAHAPIFDFEATSAGAEWIDRLAAHAKSAINGAGRPIAGHSDWSGKHFRFAEEAVTAVYDWDSLAVRSEAALVGVAAMTFTTRFDLPGVSRAPTPDEMSAFIDEYGAARETALSRDEHEQIAAHALLLAAYTARCEHCGVDGYDGDADPDSFATALRTHGSAYLQH